MHASRRPSARSAPVGVTRRATRWLRRLTARAAAPLAAVCVASVIAGCTASAQARPPAERLVRRVRTGLEVLVTDSVHLIRGKRVGLITNHTGVGSTGKSSIDALFNTPGVKLTALYGPEHGLRGEARAGDKVANAVDSATGVPIYSLYGDTRVPTEAMLKDVDIVLFDIQDVGARFYTYQWTMALSAEAVKRPFFVLDRPDPVRGDITEGNVLDPKYRSFIGQFPVATRYGMTVGELARFLVGERLITGDVTVIPMDGYRRSMWWEETGLTWINPSPNIRSVDSSILYTGWCYFEGTNLNEGRGMEIPFQMVGAPWLTDAAEIVAAMNAKRLPGVTFEATTQRVDSGYKHGGLTVPVIKGIVTDRNRIKPQQVGLTLMREIYVRHRSDWKWRIEMIERLAGGPRVREAVEKDGGVEALLAQMETEAKSFQDRTKPYWLYR